MKQVNQYTVRVPGWMDSATLDWVSGKDHSEEEQTYLIGCECEKEAAKCRSGG